MRPRAAFALLASLALHDKTCGRREVLADPASHRGRRHGRTQFRQEGCELGVAFNRTPQRGPASEGAPDRRTTDTVPGGLGTLGREGCTARPDSGQCATPTCWEEGVKAPLNGLAPPMSRPTAGSPPAGGMGPAGLQHHPRLVLRRWRWRITGRSERWSAPAFRRLLRIQPSRGTSSPA
jgi:hypothetical protein